MIKRNSIVFCTADGGFWSPYGRVVTIKDDMAFVIDCGRYARWIYLKDLKEITDYQGRWDMRRKPEYFNYELRKNMTAQEEVDFEEAMTYEVWQWMPTLRKLKQMTSGYQPKVFKKNREKHDRNRTFTTGHETP